MAIVTIIVAVLLLCFKGLGMKDLGWGFGVQGFRA